MKKQMMKKTILGLMFAAFVFCFASIETNAQIANVLYFEIPFDFYVKDKKYAAGKYNLQSLSENSNAIAFRGEETALIGTTGRKSNGEQLETEKIIFNRYGDKYFLTEIYLDRNQIGYFIAKSKTERRAREKRLESEENLAHTERKPERVEVTATSNR